MPTKTRSREMTKLFEQERLAHHKQLLEENESARAMMKQLEEQVSKRLKAARVEAEAFDEIARLASELRKTGVEMSMLIRTIKRFDRSERKAKPITRQNLNVMISNHETRQRPKPRRRRDAEPGGGVNLEVLQ
jgi:hypothetical protein